MELDRGFRQDDELRFPDQLPTYLSAKLRWQLEAESALRFILKSRAHASEFLSGSLFDRQELSNLKEAYFLYPAIDYMTSAVTADINKGVPEAETKDWGVLRLEDSDCEELFDDEPTELEKMQALALEHYPQIDTEILAAAVLPDGIQLIFVTYKHTESDTFVLPSFRSDRHASFKEPVLASQHDLAGVILEVTPRLRMDDVPEILISSDYISEQVWQREVILARRGYVSRWLDSRLKQFSSELSISADSFEIIGSTDSNSDCDNNPGFFILPNLQTNSYQECDLVLVFFKKDNIDGDFYCYLDTPVFFSEDHQLMLSNLRFTETSITAEQAGESKIAKSERISKADQSDKIEAISVELSKEESLDLLLEHFGFEQTSYSRDNAEDPALKSLNSMFSRIEKYLEIPVSIQNFRLCFVRNDAEHQELALVVSAEKFEQDLIFYYKNQENSADRILTLGMHISKSALEAELHALLASDFASPLAKKLLNIGLSLDLDYISNHLDQLAEKYEISFGFCQHQPSVESSGRVHVLITELANQDKSVVSFTYDQDFNFIAFQNIGRFEGIKLVAKRSGG